MNATTHFLVPLTRPFVTAALLAIACTFQFTLSAQAESALDLAKRISSSYDACELMLPLQRAAKEDPKNPEIHYLMAEQYITKGGCELRGIKEAEICLSLDPNSSFAPKCRQWINSWNTNLAKKGKEKTLSNLDIWFDEYYRNRPYHSWDPEAEPDWVKKLGDKRSWTVDMHFVSSDFTSPLSGKKTSPGYKYARDIMDAFGNQWRKRASASQEEGTIDVYFEITDKGIFHPMIVRCDGGEKFKAAFLETCKSLDESPALRSAASQRSIFKGRFASHNSAGNWGTWSAFTSSGLDPSTPVVVELNGTLDLHSTEQVVSGSVMMKDVKVKPEPEVSRSTAPRIIKVTMNQKPGTNVQPPHAVSQSSASKPDAADLSTIDKAKLAISAKHFDAAYELLWPLIEKDNAEASLLMAKALTDRDNGAPSPRIAEVFMGKAAALGNTEAMYMYADACEWGNAGVGMETGLRYYADAARSGNALAQLSMGRIMEFGDYVKPDPKKAQQYYELAARNGSKDAQAGIARIKTRTY
jgi:hypothetical protein